MPRFYRPRFRRFTEAVSFANYDEQYQIEERQMATVVAGPLAPSVAVDRYDRVFYSGIAIAMALMVFVGFGPTYYFGAFGDRPMATISGGPMTLLVHAHGVLFTSWVLLFIVQTALVAQHQVAVHRRLGVAGGVLAAAMIVVGTLTALKTAARGGAPAAPDPLSFLIIPLTDMILFGSFVTAALRLRKNREAHKRLMLLAYVSIIVAAVARVPGIGPLGPPAFFGLGFSFLLAGVIYDLLTRRRVHPVYIRGGAALIASVPLRLVISSTGAWQSFAASIAGLV